MTFEEMKKVKQAYGYSMEQLSEYTGVPLDILQKIFLRAGETSGYVTEQETRQEMVQALKDSDMCDCGSSDFVREPDIYGTSALKSEEPREKQQGEYTLEDYYALPDDRRVELIDGVIYDMNSPTFVHQRIAGDIFHQLLTQFEKKKGKCQPMIAPLDVRLDSDNRTMVQPDVLILCNPDQIRRWGIEGAPDFVLEVISPGTKWKDCMKKLLKYQQAGVKEYWIIDPYQKKLSVYDFSQEGWPQVFDLKGKQGLAMYDGEIVIDLDRIAPMIQDYSAAK